MNKTCSDKPLWKILLVDDAEFDRETVARALNADFSHLFELQQLETAKDVEYVALDWDPNLILLDYSLPDLNGLALLEYLVQKYRRLPFPIVMVTGTGNEAIAVESMKLGALDYLTKDSYSPGNIRLVVNRAIEKSTLQKALMNETEVRTQNQRRLELALNATGSGIWEWGIVSHQLYVTSKTKFLLAHRPDEPEWATLKDLSTHIHPGDRERIEKELNHLMAGMETHLTTEFRVEIEHSLIIRYLSCQALLEEVNGAPVRVIAVLSDVTERRNIIEEQARFLAISRMDLEKLKAEREIRDNFVATLSHDLRTPLTSAKLSAQLLLRRETVVPADKKMADRIIIDIDRTNQMIEDLLDATRLRAGQKLPIQLTLNNLRTLIACTVEELSRMYGDRIIFKTSQDTLNLRCDIRYLRRVIENLVSNAVKYGAPNSPITISLSQKEAMISIAVHNQGSELTETEQLTLFDAFKRTHSAETGGKKGWGLGLTLVQGVVHAHGGKVFVQSGLGHGTTFILELPTEIPTHHANPTPKTQDKVSP